jgi:hypothetical protein
MVLCALITLTGVVAQAQVIRRMAAPVGVVKVTDVDDMSSVCSAISGTDFKVGDAVKTKTQ